MQIHRHLHRTVCKVSTDGIAEANNAVGDDAAVQSTSSDHVGKHVQSGSFLKRLARFTEPHAFDFNVTDGKSFPDEWIEFDPLGQDVASALLGGGLGKLDDGDADDLSDDNGPIGPGDLAWAFQWDLTLEPGASFVLSINKLIEIPAPAAAPVGVWFICMLAGRRSKK